jgi:hypothetical protein
MDGSLVAFWMLCSIIGALIADNRGGNWATGFWLGLIFGPFGLLFSLFTGGEDARASKELASGKKKRCPRCAELVQRAALVCKHCGHEFAEAEEDTAPSAEVSAASEKSETATTFTVLMIFLGMFAVAIVALSGMPSAQ